MAAKQQNIDIAVAIESLSNDINDDSAAQHNLDSSAVIESTSQSIEDGSADTALTASAARISTLAQAITDNSAPAHNINSKSRVELLIKDIVSRTTSIVSDFTMNVDKPSTSEAPLTSPVMIQFQAYDFDDGMPRDEMGHYFNFDDPDSGTHDLTTMNNSRNEMIGGAYGAHTFEVADGQGTQSFAVRCRRWDGTGAEEISELVVYVQAQDAAYSGANTIAVSNSLNVLDDWSLDSYDINCPSGATQLASVDDVNWSNIDNRRVILKRGDIFLRLKYSGTHTGANSSADLVDSGAPFTASELINHTIRNVTDGSRFTCDANTTTTVSYTDYTINSRTFPAMGGGTNNHWNTGDAYEIYELTDDAIDELIIQTGSNNFVIDHFGDLADARPEVSIIHVGTESTTSTNHNLSDAQLSSAASTHSNDGWCEDFTIANLRCPEIANPMSYLRATIHNIDMDFEFDDDGGGISFNNGDFCYKAAGDISPSNVKFPVGMAISEVYSRGSLNSPPGLNIAGVSESNPCKLSVIGCNLAIAAEHNIRLHGTQQAIFAECDLLGQIASVPSKHNLTLRSFGRNRVGDHSTLTKGDNGMGSAIDEDDVTKIASSGHILIQNVTGTSGNMLAGTANFHVASSSGGLADYVLMNNVVILDSVENATGDIIFSSRYTTITGTTFAGGSIFDQTGTNSIDNGTDNNIVDGVVGTDIVDMLSGATALQRIDESGESAYTLPVPTAPR